jgi:hypothetical protein
MPDPAAVSAVQVETSSHQHLLSLHIVLAEPTLSATERMALILALANDWDADTKGQRTRTAAEATALDWWNTKAREYSAAREASNERTSR